MLSHAMSAASRGWAVFPCRYMGKEPLTEHGFHDATTDRDRIFCWWRRWPRANVAIATGAASGLVVVDIDPAHGGHESLADLEVLHGELPCTVEVVTGSGGRHLYFKHPGFTVSNSAGRVGKGIDVRGDGGYVVAPPSLHRNGRRYAWEVSAHPDDAPIADMPHWLVARMGAPMRHPEKSGEGSYTIGAPIPLGRAALAFIAGGAPIGEQRSRAVAAARNLLSAGFTIEAAADAVWTGLQASEWDAAREPWSERDALAMVRDLASKPAPPPRPPAAATQPRRWAMEVAP